MVYFLANRLKKSPDEISCWGVSVLSVMFADIVNSEYRQNKKQYDDLKAEERAKMGEPWGVKIQRGG